MSSSLMTLKMMMITLAYTIGFGSKRFGNVIWKKKMMMRCWGGGYVIGNPNVRLLFKDIFCYLFDELNEWMNKKLWRHTLSIEARLISSCELMNNIICFIGVWDRCTSHLHLKLVTFEDSGFYSWWSIDFRCWSPLVETIIVFHSYWKLWITEKRSPVHCYLIYKLPPFYICL